MSLAQQTGISQGEEGGARRGGREARRAMRAAPLAVNERPVNPGMRGGRFQALLPHEIEKIHHAALDVLAEIGFADAIPSCVEAITGAGGKLESNGRLTFPRSLVEDTVAEAARHFVLYGQDPKHDMEPWDKKVYFGTAGAAVNIVDPISGAYRESNVQDLYDIARVVDTLDHIHFFQRTTVCRDLPDPLGGTIPASVAHRTALSELADRFAIVVKDTAALLPQQATA